MDNIDIAFQEVCAARLRRLQFFLGKTCYRFTELVDVSGLLEECDDGTYGILDYWVGHDAIKSLDVDAARVANKKPPKLEDPNGYGVLRLFVKEDAEVRPVEGDKLYIVPNNNVAALNQSSRVADIKLTSKVYSLSSGKLQLLFGIDESLTEILDAYHASNEHEEPVSRYDRALFCWFDAQPMAKLLKSLDEERKRALDHRALASLTIGDRLDDVDGWATWTKAEMHAAIQQRYDVPTERVREELLRGCDKFQPQLGVVLELLATVHMGESRLRRDQQKYFKPDTNYAIAVQLNPKLYARNVEQYMKSDVLVVKMMLHYLKRKPLSDLLASIQDLGYVAND